MKQWSRCVIDTTLFFQSELRMLKGLKANLRVVKDVVPKFCELHPVPYALRDTVNRELFKLEAEGVISPVNYSEWAAHIVCKERKKTRVSVLNPCIRSCKKSPRCCSHVASFARSSSYL